MNDKIKITTSSIGAILGVAEYERPKDIMRRMVRSFFDAESELEENFATNYTKSNKMGAIFDFNLEVGSEMIVNEEFFQRGYFLSNPDGFIGDDSLVYIRTPLSKKDTADFDSIHDQMNYLSRVQYDLFCTGRSQCYFFQWSPKGTMLEVVEFQQSFIDGTLPRLKEFYDRYQEELKNPDKHLTPLVKTLDACKASIRYEEALKTFNEAKLELDEAKQELINLANGNKTVIGDLLVYPIEKQGSISYSKAVKELLPDADLEKYRGKPSTSWGVR